MRSLILAALCLSAPMLAHGQSADVYDPNEPVVTQPSAQPGNSELPAGMGTVLVSGGPFVTSVGTGPGGSDISLLQNGTLGLTTLGAGFGAATTFSVTDDFVVPAGQTWQLSGVRFFGYQTGSPTAPSSMNDVRYQIWNGRPGDMGSTVLFGDLTTNRFVSSVWTNAYRTAEGAVGTTRPIMAAIGGVGAPISLTAGTYWIEWKMGGTLPSGPFQPTVSIIGQTVTGNARQGNSGVFVDLLDGGTMTAQGLPFEILGNISAGNLTITTSPLDFGTVAVGGTGTGSITLGNDGSGNLTVSALAPTAPFARTGGTCGDVPITIAAASNCTVTFSFSPAVTGAVTQVVTVTSNGTGANSLTLQGTGAAPGVLSSSTTTVSFGGVAVGGFTTSTIIVTNTGGSPFTLTGITGATGAFSVTGGTCVTALVLAPTASCTIIVRFAPTSVGTSTGSLQLVTTSPSTTTVNLNGTGNIP
ncbi:MAG: choice-of-anchor D domain-containing protein, partial [Pseudomarimonas sp.]